jgi:hypothetical protein
VHYGSTGTGIWVSPGRQRWAILLTNTFYYSRDSEPLTCIHNRFHEVAYN